MLYGLDLLEYGKMDHDIWDIQEFFQLCNETGIDVDAEYAVITNDIEHCSGERVIDIYSDEFNEDLVGINAVLHLSGSLDSLDDFIYAFSNLVKNYRFPWVVSPEQSSNHFPYSKYGLTQLFLLNGYDLQMPYHKLPGTIITSLR